MRRQIAIELIVLLALASLTARVDAQGRPGSPQSAKAALPPLVLAEQGSFFVNVQTIESRFPSGNGTPAAGHISGKGMYVQYQIPKDRRGTAYPVVMVHGSSHTAKTYEDTPDGRMGWAEYFVRRGVPTYVVDHAGRARSGFDPSPTNQARLEKNAAACPSFTAVHERERLDHLQDRAHRLHCLSDDEVPGRGAGPVLRAARAQHRDQLPG